MKNNNKKVDVRFKQSTQDRVLKFINNVKRSLYKNYLLQGIAVKEIAGKKNDLTLLGTKRYGIKSVFTCSNLKKAVAKEQIACKTVQDAEKVAKQIIDAWKLELIKLHSPFYKGGCYIDDTFYKREYYINGNYFRENDRDIIYLYNFEKSKFSLENRAKRELIRELRKLYLEEFPEKKEELRDFHETGFYDWIQENDNGYYKDYISKYIIQERVNKIAMDIAVKEMKSALNKSKELAKYIAKKTNNNNIDFKSIYVNEDKDEVFIRIL